MFFFSPTACLDGSPPAYFNFEGFGDGVSNWIVYLEVNLWLGNDLPSNSINYYKESFSYIHIHEKYFFKTVILEW